MKKKRTEAKLNALIFIDTNILLDFYRLRKSDISLKYLAEIETHRNILILTSQVEMEFRKNRQHVILEAFNEVNKSPSNSFSVPTILFDAKPVSMIKKAQTQIVKQHEKIKARIGRLLSNPLSEDKVFMTLQRVFKTVSEFNLNRKNNKRYAIRKLALRRFYLGYPPRKKNDNSIGDAINWEWIIDCASRTDKHIIIVTRDSDYGVSHNSSTYLNDWLQLEFRERVSQKRNLILTDKLSLAFKLVEIPVTQEMVEEEQQVIDKLSLNSQIADIQEHWLRMQQVLRTPEFEEANQKLADASKGLTRVLKKVHKKIYGKVAPEE